MSSTNKPPAKKRKIDYSDEFKVIVGSGAQAKTYTVAKDVLIQSSKYLRAACDKVWKSGQNKIITLADERPAAFEVYLQWLNTGHIVLTDAELKLPEDMSVLKTMTTLFVDVYILAEMLLDASAKNSLVDYLLERHEEHSYDVLLEIIYCEGIITTVYGGTTAGSPLRRFLVDFECASLEESGDKDEMMNFPTEFVADIALNLLELIAQGLKPDYPPYIWKCGYHEHDEENPACT